MLLFGMHPTMAVELPPMCRQLYQIYTSAELTYEAVGKLADKMHENNCWPALQGLLVFEPEAPASALPEVVDCPTLGQHIVDWSRRDYSESDPDWVILKLYEQRP